MSNYLVTDTDMTSVADAIRTKGGTSASLAFPTGFVNAINDIPSGGGAGGFIDVTSQYNEDADYPDGYIYAYLNRATGEVIIGGQLNGSPYLMMNGGLPVENCFGTCTITHGYYYESYNNMTISNGVITMPSLTAMDNRVLFVILQAQGGGSIY